jgi:uncharacterized protein (DUF924 family)
MSPFDEGLLELFSHWYGGVPPDLRIEAHGGITGAKMAELWRTLWFAKGALQAGVDAALRAQFEPLLRQVDLAPGAALPSPPARFSPRQATVWRLGLLILLDQVTRNVYRNSAGAYSGDALARRLVEQVMPQFDALPLPCRLSLVLVYIHSEDVADVARVEALLARVKASPEFGRYSEVWPSMTGIATNHRDRMLLLGRVPERNQWLGRASTQQELAYMAAVLGP